MISKNDKKIVAGLKIPVDSNANFSDKVLTFSVNNV